MSRQPRIRVLIADDDPGFLEALAIAMETDGRFEVVALAGNGAEAFQMGCWHEPNVIVMDVEMPIIGGIEAARLLRESRPRTCVLMVSGGDEVVAHHASTDRAAVFVSKSKFDSIPDAVARLASARDSEKGFPPGP